MTEHLQHAGISDPQNIDHYTLRSETDNDILKIYYLKEKGQIFQKSIKLKFPRQLKSVLAESGVNRYVNTSEIDANLVHILAELDELTDKKSAKADTKAKVFADLKHLEKVVMNKIKEIEDDLKKLQ
jgi:hypothetical protein